MQSFNKQAFNLLAIYGEGVGLLFGLGTQDTDVPAIAHGGYILVRVVVVHVEDSTPLRVRRKTMDELCRPKVV